MTTDDDENTQGEANLGIPNFTQGEIDVFLSLASQGEEIERLRQLIISLGMDPDTGRQKEVF